MRRNIFKNLLLAFFTALIFVCLFTKSNDCVQGIKDGIALCMGSIIPSLFPFMIASQFVIKSGLADFFGFCFEKITKKIFKLSGICSSVIFMSLIGGFPVGAKMTSDLLESKKISKNEAQRLNMFCINAGPAFIIGTVGEIFAGSKKAGIILFISTVISSLCVGLMTAFLCDNNDFKDDKLSAENITNPITAFSHSMSDASKAMLSVCSWVIVFNAIIKCILSSGDKGYTIALCSILEVTSGLKLSCGVLPVPALAAILSFGGISVHCQIFSYIQKSKISFRLFYASRLICAALSALICHLILKICPFEIEVFSTNTSITASAYSVSLPSAVALIIMCCSLIFEVDTNKNMC